MPFFTDLHIHSKYSRGTSNKMTLPNIASWAEKKGIKVVATSDFTHPVWFQNIEDQLELAESGLFRLRRSQEKDATRFILSTEIACIYTKNAKVRRLHHIVLTPSLNAVGKIRKSLSKVGNLSADGRPMLGLDSKELLKIILDADRQSMLIPAHAWTPWFSIFGSKSGFDSIEECFEELSSHIYAIETGLSSDPAMNARLSKLDSITLVSNSDAHSPHKLGREANFFATELSYRGIVDAIKSKDPKKFLYTIEFFPEEGKYHYDGHRKCGIFLSPKETQKLGGICPRCKRSLTIGVMYRVCELADRAKSNAKPSIPFHHLIPLEEIIAGGFKCGVETRKVSREYEKMISCLGNEFEILLHAKRSDLERITDLRIAEGIMRVREGKVNVKPGYDGVYGEIKVFDRKEIKKTAKVPAQSGLFSS